MDFTEMILLDFPADYDFDSPGIIHIGDNGDIAAYICGDFTGPCIIFCHGNGETAVSEKELFDELAASGISVISPDYRGYGMSEGKLSEEGCYEAAHAAYDYLKEKGVLSEDIYVLGYSLGSAVAVELAASQTVGGLILQAPFFNGDQLKRFWLEDAKLPVCDTVDNSFPTSSRLASVLVPSLVIHGTKDDVIPFSQGEAVFKHLASKEKTFMPVENADHSDFQTRMGKKYISTLLDFIYKGCVPQ